MSDEAVYGGWTLVCCEKHKQVYYVTSRMPQEQCPLCEAEDFDLGDIVPDGYWETLRARFFPESLTGGHLWHNLAIAGALCQAYIDGMLDGPKFYGDPTIREPGRNL